MKIVKSVVQGALGLITLGSVATYAQELQTVEIEGTVNGFSAPQGEQIDPALLDAATFKFVVEHDLSAYINVICFCSDDIEKSIPNNLTRISYTFYDALGMEIQPTLTSELVGEEIANANHDIRFTPTSSGQDYVQWWGRNAASGQDFVELGGYLQTTDVADVLFAEPSDIGVFPYTAPSLAYDLDMGLIFSGWYRDGDISPVNSYHSFSGTVTSVFVSLPDIDGDGVPDEADSCMTSVTGETVLFDGWHDSGVTNYVDESGCTVMDHYAACEVEQEEQEVSRFSLRSSFFYSGPSYCEKQVAYGLVSDGLIDYSEARALRDALYYSSRNNGPG
jgi:hypothetical protein